MPRAVKNGMMLILYWISPIIIRIISVKVAKTRIDYPEAAKATGPVFIGDICVPSYLHIKPV